MQETPPACMCLCLHSARTCCFKPKTLKCSTQTPFCWACFTDLYINSVQRQSRKVSVAAQTHVHFSVKKQMFVRGALCKRHTFENNLNGWTLGQLSACVTYLQAVANLDNKTVHHIEKKNSISKRGRGVFTIATNDTWQRSRRTDASASWRQSNSWKCH